MHHHHHHPPHHHHHHHGGGGGGSMAVAAGAELAMIASLQRDVSSLRAQLAQLEFDARVYTLIVEKRLVEESPVLNTLRDCFPTLRHTPRELVDQHAALVHSTDKYDNASYTYPVRGGVYVFECRKDKHLFSKDEARVKVWFYGPKGY